MHYPRLFYGICLGRIPEEYIRLPKGIVDRFGRISLRRLERAADKHELSLFYTDDLSEQTSFSDSIHLGIEIAEENLALSVSGYECRSFAINQIVQLVSDSSPLVKKLYGMGIRILRSDCRLYGIIQ